MVNLIGPSWADLQIEEENANNENRAALLNSSSTAEAAVTKDEINKQLGIILLTAKAARRLEGGTETEVAKAAIANLMHPNWADLQKEEENANKENRAALLNSSGSSSTTEAAATKDKINKQLGIILLTAKTAARLEEVAKVAKVAKIAEEVVAEKSA